MYNGTESTMYSNITEAKEYEIDYECMKYLDKYPRGQYYQEVSNILLSKMENMVMLQEHINWGYGIHL